MYPVTPADLARVLYDLVQVEEEEVELTYSGPVQSITLSRELFWAQVSQMCKVIVDVDSVQINVLHCTFLRYNQR